MSILLRFHYFGDVMGSGSYHDPLCLNLDSRKYENDVMLNNRTWRIANLEIKLIWKYKNDVMINKTIRYKWRIVNIERRGWNLEG